MLRNEETYVHFVWFVSSEPCDDSLPSASLQNGDLLGSISRGLGNGGGAREMVGRSDKGKARLLAELFETLLFIDYCSV
jgi:hypothetical protein